EALGEVDVLARAGGRRDGFGDLTPLLCELPGDHVLEPLQGVGLERTAQSDAGVDVHVSEVVGGDGQLIADDLAHTADVVGDVVHADGGDVRAGERVHGEG